MLNVSEPAGRSARTSIPAVYANEDWRCVCEDWRCVCGLGVLSWPCQVVHGGCFSGLDDAHQTFIEWVDLNPTQMSGPRLSARTGSTDVPDGIELASWTALIERCCVRRASE
jgi:hypothetical protein